MSTNANTGSGRRASYWAWPGPARIYVAAIFCGAWIPVLVFARKSELAIASTVALTLCAGVLDIAVQRDPTKWTPYISWVMRIVAALTGGWLFTAAATLTDGFMAVTAYAVLYILCEWAVWHRLRTNRSHTT